MRGRARKNKRKRWQKVTRDYPPKFKAGNLVVESADPAVVHSIISREFTPSIGWVYYLRGLAIPVMENRLIRAEKFVRMSLAS